MINCCTVYFLPSTKAGLYFDKGGVCAACIAYRDSKAIDWKILKLEFSEIIERIHSTSKIGWDYIVPARIAKILLHRY